MANLYSIFDVKASKYGPIISFENDNTAIRSFMEMLISGDKNSLLALYPTDYLLYCVGSFDQDTGLVATNPAPLHIVSGLECIHRAVDEVNRRKRMQKALEEGTFPNSSGTPDITQLAPDVASSDNLMESV